MIGSAALDADFETLTEIFREKIDPYRWDLMLWGLAVLQAKVWFALEEELPPGKRGYGKMPENESRELRLWPKMDSATAKSPTN